ncbi:hypothetical protein [Microbacterium sp. PRC9]|uniref:carboxymuconolactone decarboxylase family protein n=1 Tax=Microbacterium sp. PRC9 TaxID=2962591 RepID=UPI0028824A50|nr:hypothetical protein [Microbacterium sp. PRC9]MDT0144536.1 hypothetical protein [Microbacterium sp. PRC9]
MNAAGPVLGSSSALWDADPRLAGILHRLSATLQTAEAATTDASARRFAAQLVDDHFVDDDTFDAVLDTLGPTGVVRLIGAIGGELVEGYARCLDTAEDAPVLALPDDSSLQHPSRPSRRRRVDPDSPLSPDQLAALGAGDRPAALRGPFRLWALAPDIHSVVEELGTYCQHETTLPERIGELAIMTVARRRDAQHPWIAHREKARASGIPEAALEALAAGDHPAFDDAADEAVFDLVDALARGERPAPETVLEVRAALNDAQLADLIASVGVYAMNALILNAFELPLPGGAEPPFPDVRDFRKVASATPIPDPEENSWIRSNR